MTALVTANMALLAGSDGGIANLRSLILDLAIRGQLVMQEAAEEPADELLVRIAKLKAGMPLRAKTKPTGPVASLHVLPRGWVWTTLADAALINPRNQADDQSDASFVPMAAIGTGFNDEHVQQTRKWGEIKTGFTHFAEGDIGVAKITPCFENSKACVFTTLVNGLGAGTTELHVIRPLGGTLAPRYVLAYLKAPWFLATGEAKMTGTAGQKRLPKDFVERHPFPMPPLAEQHRIVAKVDEQMALCDRLEARQQDAEAAHAQLVQTLLDSLTQARDADEFQASWERLAGQFELVFTTNESIAAAKHAVLVLAFAGHLLTRASGPTADRPTALPEGWREVQISDIAAVGTGATPARTNPAYFDPPEFPWVTSGETSSALIATTVQRVSALALTETNLTLYPPGTLVVAMYGQGKTRGQVSELAIEACTNQACAAIQLKDSPPAHRQYVKYFFEKSYDELRELAAGGAQPNLNLGVMFQ